MCVNSGVFFSERTVFLNLGPFKEKACLSCTRIQENDIISKAVQSQFYVCKFIQMYTSFFGRVSLPDYVYSVFGIEISSRVSVLISAQNLRNMFPKLWKMQIFLFCL